MLDLKGCMQAPVAKEFEGAKLGDARRTRRLQQIADKAMQAPDVGFPRMVADDSELEGVYRFFGCGDIEAEDVLAPHIEATAQRVRDVAGPVLVIHDTTDLSFGGHSPREGLGRTHGKRQGFLLHLALAVLPGEDRLPLGTCGMLRICRSEYKGSTHKDWLKMAKDPTRESLRWGQLFEQVNGRFGPQDCIHIMDREGDHFDLMALMRRQNGRFIIRGCHDRVLTSEQHLFERIETLRPRTYREIHVSERIDDGRRTGDNNKPPPRRARSARVAIAGCSVTIRRTKATHAPEKELALNVVRVWETDPPRGVSSRDLWTR